MTRAVPGRRARPGLALEPPSIETGFPFVVRGVGWDVVPLVLTIDRQTVPPQRILEGVPVGEGFRPAPDGAFAIELSARGLAPGRHTVGVRAACDEVAAVASRRLVVAPHLPAGPRRRGETAEEHHRRALKAAGGGGPLLRREDWFRRRFGHLGRIPDGVRTTQVASVRALRDRARGDEVPGQPVAGVCNWTPVGPGPVIVDAARAFAGRVISIAFDPVVPATIYVGAANGGVWKSTDRGITWVPKSDFQMSLAIGALAVDPHDRQRIVAGTGQYGAAVGTYYGNGLLRSIDGGETWTELARTTFERDEISRVLFDPTDLTSQRLFLSSRQGVYQSLDGGTNWTLLRAGAASDLAQVATGGGIRLVAAFHGSGIWTATRTGTVWSAWTQVQSAAFPTGFVGRIVLGQSANSASNIYAAFSSGAGIAGIARTSDAGVTWTTVVPPLVADIDSRELSSATVVGYAGAPAHAHSLIISGAAMAAGTLAYTTGAPTGGAAHTHGLTLTAAQLATVRGGTGSVTVTTSAAPDGHSHTVVVDRRLSGQTWYDFHISPHPDDPDTVYYGEIRLWKSTTGGGPWTQLPILHADNHAFAFAPDDADEVWSVGDGGVFVSPDAGGSFAHRNRDLQTLEYISVAQHPTWETVMIGGTQDNGTQRYTGSPAWELVAGGDGGFTAIDPGTPTRMYQEYIYSTFYRSDASGAPLTWVRKGFGIGGTSDFYAPFALDPSDPSACYFGGSQLWRSPDAAETWAAITNSINDIVSAIAVHPTDSTRVYVGSSSGRVRLVQRTGATWTLADVTTTDITGTNLPGGYVSDLAVDPSGNVWATFASILQSEWVAEFTNDHVWRRPAAGGAWVNRSSGLAQANPVNAIAIDPANPNRLFCGCDIGVFRTDDAGQNWVPWDPGLPNAAVFDLRIHAARRLVRAATHGRSVWERPIDPATCPPVDLYMRDSILDSGRVQPTPEAPHPFDASIWAGHWTSEDIKVDAPEPGFQTTNPIADYVAFASLRHRTARRDRTNRFSVQVHNRGVAGAHDVRVRGFFAPASVGLPPLPADFWTGGRPFAGTPSGPNWTPVGPTVSLGDLAPGEPGVATWSWLVPLSAPRHSCLLAVATCLEDPTGGAGTLDPDALVSNSKHVTLKNLVLEDAVAGTAMAPDQAMSAEMHSSSPEDRVADLRIRWGSLPRGTRIFLAFSLHPDGGPALALPNDAGRHGLTLTDTATDFFPEHARDALGCRVPYDRTRVVIADRPRRGVTDLAGLRLTHGSPVLMVMNVLLPEKAAGLVNFDLMRMSGDRTVGGIGYQLRVAAP